MFTCASYYAAVLAVPQLVPAAVLAPDVSEVLEMVAGDLSYKYMAESIINAHHNDVMNAELLLKRAAQIHPLTVRVRLQGFSDQVSAS